MLGRIRGKPRDDDPALEELRRRTAARLAAIVGLNAETEPEDDLDPADEPGSDAVAMAVAPADEAHEEIPLASDESPSGRLRSAPAQEAGGGIGEAPRADAPVAEAAVTEAPVVEPPVAEPPVAATAEAAPEHTPVAEPEAPPEDAAPAAAEVGLPPPALPARVPIVLPESVVGVMAEPVASAARVPSAAVALEAPRGEAVPVAAAVAPRVPAPAAELSPVDVPAAELAPAPTGAPGPEPARPAPSTGRAAGPPVRPAPPPAAEAASKAARPPTGASRTAPRQAARPAAASAPKPAPRPAPKPTARRRRAISTLLPAACPTCGALLEAIPTSARRCPDCRARIVVKRVEGRIVLLSETVVPLFDAERRRQADAERLKRAGGRWLQMAALAGAAPEVLEKRARALAARPTSEAVSAARTLYATTVERACRAARRAKDWKTVSDLRLRQARAYHRTLGTQLPVDASVVALHREAMEAMLRRIAEVSREAELVGGTCCEACSAQSGRVVRISAELKAPSLPHADCPAGLCGCRWDVPSKHREAVTRLTRRRPR